MVSGKVELKPLNGYSNKWCQVSGKQKSHTQTVGQK